MLLLQLQYVAMDLLIMPKKRVFRYCKARNMPVLGARFPRWLDFVLWCRIFRGFQSGMCFTIPHRHLEFQGDSNIFQKFVDLWVSSFWWHRRCW